jgi:hypothetical protein
VIQRLYTCDVCGQIKGTENQWYRASTTVSRGIVFYHWNPEPHKNDLDEYHMCGRECCITVLSKWAGNKENANESFGTNRRAG